MRCLVEGCKFEFYEDDVDKRQDIMMGHYHETGHNDWQARWKWQK